MGAALLRKPEKIKEVNNRRLPCQLFLIKGHLRIYHQKSLVPLYIRHL